MTRAVPVVGLATVTTTVAGWREKPVGQFVVVGLFRFVAVMHTPLNNIDVIFNMMKEVAYWKKICDEFAKLEKSK